MNKHMKVFSAVLHIKSSHLQYEWALRLNKHGCAFHNPDCTRIPHEGSARLWRVSSCQEEDAYTPCPKQGMGVVVFVGQAIGYI